MGCLLSTKCPDRIQPTCDGYRGTPLRLLGYATHVGNACSALIPYHMSNVPHMVTTAYVCSDVFNKALRSSEEGESRKRVIVNTFDAIIWQTLATLILPGLVVDSIKYYTLKATTYKPNSCSPPPPLVKALPPQLLRALPCIFGVLALPIIMYPIDKGVSLLMDGTYRSIFKKPDPAELKRKCKKAPPKVKKPEAA